MLASGMHYYSKLRTVYTDNPFSFAERVIRASKGEKGIVEPTFVYLPGVEGGDAIAKQTGVDFFSVPIELGVSIIPTPKSFIILYRSS